MLAGHSACCVQPLGPSPGPSRHGRQQHARRGRQRAVRRAAPRITLADGDVIWSRVPVYRHSAWGEGLRPAPTQSRQGPQVRPMAGGHQAGVSVGTEHAPYNTGGAAEKSVKRWRLRMMPGAKLARCITVASMLLCALPGAAQIVTDPPEARSPVTLLAVSDRESGRVAFAFAGTEQAPVLRALPGESIRITYTNAMAPASTEKCATGPCMNMTNLHFHGLHVSPNAPQDDVLTMLAMPGESLQYAVYIPHNQPPGLYWYHTHPHGESYRQVLDGMSGAIVIEGIERYVPEIRNMRERILVLRDR